MQNQKKTIAILGAGFAGLRVALSLQKKLALYHEYKLIIIDQNDVHVYTSDLYEIATAFHEKITEECLTKLKDTVAIPLSKIIPNGNIDTVRDKVIAIHPKERTVELEKNKTMQFTYLVLTLGSVVNYYDISGLRQFSYPLKTLTDALAINCQLDHYFQTLWKKETQKKIHIVVGGGGATGIEFACELPGCIKKICKKYAYPYEQVEITIIEGSNQLGGQGEKVTARILKRLEKFNIKVLRSTLIKYVTVDSIHAKSSSGSSLTLSMDILIWTGGVMPNPIIKASFSEISETGGLKVNEFLQHEKFPYIYAAGDNAHVTNKKTGEPMPMLAQVAFRQGKIIARNIIADINKNPKKSYSQILKGVIIPLGGEYAVIKKGDFVFAGFTIWVLRRLIDLWYAISILPFTYALRKWIHDTNVFVEND